MRDSSRYADSIFYTEWSSVTEYASVDRAVIQMLYSDMIHPNMNEEQVRKTLHNISGK